MEPVTHILTGACLSRAGFNRRAAYATLTMAVAAEFPDIDTLWGLAGPVTGFQHHRGITHTFIGLPVEAGVVVGAVYLLHLFLSKRAAVRPASSNSGFEPPAPVRWGLLYCFALVALLSHLFLDYTNNYGLRPFFPFDPRWFAGSFVFIFDPLIFLLLAMAFVMPLLFALVNSEVGARRQRFRGRGWAIASLLGICVVWGLRATEHARAVLLASAQSVAQPIEPPQPAGDSSTPDTAAPTQWAQPVRVLANPDPFSPFRWHVVSDFGGFYRLADVNLLNNSLTPAQDIHVKPAPSPALLAAETSRLGRAYLDWSPMPILTVSPPGDPTRSPSDVQDDPGAASATIVTFRDPRFMIDVPLMHARPNPPLTGTVELGQKLQVLRQTMDGKVQHQK